VTLFDASFYRNPYPVYDKLRSSGPVQQIPDVLGPLPAWLVTGHDEARQIFAEPSISKNTRKFQYLFDNAGVPDNVDDAVANTIIATDPPDHTRLRKLAAKAFTPASIEQLRPRIAQITATLLDAMESHGRADLVTAFAAPLPVTVISELLGVPEPDRENLRQWSNASFAEHDGTARRHATGNLARYIAGLIAARRDRPGDDLTSRLIGARDTTGTLSDSELLSMIIILLIAGHETSTTLITNAVYAMLQHPAQFAALRGNPSLIPGAIDEFLRYESPVAIATIRYTTEPITVGGVTIPAEQIIMISPAAANRDPARYNNPDELDISRDASGHLGFGHGIHYCLGAQLARTEAETAIPALLAHFPDLSLDTSHENLRWRHTRLIRGLESLPVRW
jgi:cytochrome P450